MELSCNFTPRIVRRQRRWKLFNLNSCLRQIVQISAPYKRMLSAFQFLFMVSSPRYAFSFVCSVTDVRLLLEQTLFESLPKDVAALPSRVLSSLSRVKLEHDGA